MPHRCGAVTASTAFVAIAASTAFPPSWNVATPADVARWSAEATRWLGARTDLHGGPGDRSVEKVGCRHRPTYAVGNACQRRSPPIDRDAARHGWRGLAIVAMFGPWVAQGSASRSASNWSTSSCVSDYAPVGPVGLALRIVADGAAVGRDRHDRRCVLVRWPRDRRAGPLVVGLTSAPSAGGVERCPTSILLGSRWGSLVGALGGATMVVGGLVIGRPRHVGPLGAAPTPRSRYQTPRHSKTCRNSSGRSVMIPSTPRSRSRSHLGLVVDRPHVHRRRRPGGSADEARRDDGHVAQAFLVPAVSVPGRHGRWNPTIAPSIRSERSLVD